MKYQYTYGTEEAYVNAIHCSTLDEDVKQVIIKREKVHYDAAKKLGHDVEYSISFEILRSKIRNYQSGLEFKEGVSDLELEEIFSSANLGENEEYILAKFNLDLNRNKIASMTTHDLALFRQCMEQARFPEEYINEVIEHEKAHYKKALELSYSPKYTLRVKITSRRDKGILSAAVNINPDFEKGENMDGCLRDLEEIISAPINLSESDKKQIKQVRKFMRKKVSRKKVLRKLAKIGGGK